MAAARARGGGDVRERAPHGENENGLERKKIIKKKGLGVEYMEKKN